MNDTSRRTYVAGRLLGVGYWTTKERDEEDVGGRHPNGSAEDGWTDSLTETRQRWIVGTINILVVY